MRLLTLTSVVAAALLGVAVPTSAQTFVFGAQGEPVQLDPAVITDGISSRLTRQIFDGLVKYRGATTEVEPALAEKWEVSRDGKVWTFQLRRSVKFHDGTPLDAAAVVWNFERWWKTAHPQHDNQVKAGQTFEYWEAQFAGFDDKSIVSAAEAVGTHTVRITLKEPQAPFLANLAMFVFDIASPKAVERWGTEFGKHPVGTGAYRFVEWKPNQEVVLEANPDFGARSPRSSASSCATSRTTRSVSAPSRPARSTGWKDSILTTSAWSRGTRASSYSCGRRTRRATSPSTTR
jgi:ABC-type transport system substrate-binding protein